MVKYEMKGKKAYLHVVQQQRAEEDECLTDSEVEVCKQLDAIDSVLIKPGWRIRAR